MFLFPKFALFALPTVLLVSPRQVHALHALVLTSYQGPPALKLAPIHFSEMIACVYLA